MNPPDPMPAVIDDGRHDFDFCFGHWQIRNERLRERLADCDDWEVFEATQICRPVLDGLGNVDEFVADHPPADPFLGLTLRLFEPASGEWRLYWASSRDGVLDAPVVGRFEDGVGTFLGPAEHEGRPVLMRFVWDGIGRNHAHWHQAYSTDGGTRWETNWHMWLRRRDDAGCLLHDDNVVELRRYTLRPGMRDALVKLFEEAFIEPQEAVGMHVIGQFHDLDDPDCFVWLRGFEGMPARAQALQAFYGGPVWRRHRGAANATMLDSDDVLLLRPARPGSGFATASQPRMAAGGDAAAEGTIVAGICALARPAGEGFDAVFESRFAPLLERIGARLLARYVTEPAENTFPGLPVREGEQVFVWFAGFDSASVHTDHLGALAREPAWQQAIEEAMDGDLREPPVLLRLQPTPRSELRR